jgi:hypothetical protein
VIVAEDIPETSRVLGQTLEETREAIAKGHAPMAEGIILIDFDGTISPFGPLFEFPAPLPGAIEAIKAFQEGGMKVIIFTSRLSPLWLESVGQTTFQHIDYITKYLGNFGITPDGFTAQKVPAIAMIDDKAYRYDNNWDELRRIILNG